ncbi:MAG: VCBS repeat-containing protein, partial [Gammaproteobacteria bacterium]|nr:VCBS repeat-containing protein [Gammaproteobacteria bacterium]
MSKLRILALATLCLFSCTTEKPLNLSEQDIADNNRGVAQMGYFDYTGARDTFAALVERQPQWLEAKLNLAIATLNRQQEGDEMTALAIASEVLAAEPDNLRAHYISGILSQNNGDIDAAATHFQVVADGDPNDAYATYFLGQALKQQGHDEQALALYQRAIELDPYLRSAYYGAALALRQAGRADEAGVMLKSYQRFEDNPRARLAELKYTRMGPKAEAKAIGLSQPPAVAPLTGPVLMPPELIGQVGALQARSTITTVDINADGRQDLFVTRVGAQDKSALLMNQGSEFRVADHPLAAMTAINAVAWGDFDNDGRVDAYLCRNGANQLWRQDAKGGWQDVSDSTGTANGVSDCAD